MPAGTAAIDADVRGGRYTWVQAIGRVLRQCSPHLGVSQVSALRMAVDGPFSLAAAAAFGFGPNTGRPYPGAEVMRLAFVADDLRHQVGAVVRQLPGGDLVAELAGPADPVAAERQIRRILAVDRPAEGWLSAGRADPVLGRVQAEFPGQRPVLFHSPYEAAAWAMLSQRRHRNQAAAVRNRLSASAGRSFELAGREEHAFPLPAQLLAVDSFPGIDEVRLRRLHGVAQAALDGQLEPAVLAELPAEQAMAGLQTIPGLGPVYAGLVYLRATGVADALVSAEPRLKSCLRHFYQLTELPDEQTMRHIAEPWRPFRTWAAVLFRVAGDRAGLSAEQPPRLARRAS
jgi:DNA-3-methyladenine glycosylase II